MHHFGCSQRLNPYGDCSCAAIEQRSHTDALERCATASKELSEAMQTHDQMMDEKFARLRNFAQAFNEWRLGKKTLRDVDALFDNL